MGFSRRRYEAVLERIAEAARKAGRLPGEVELVSVTKTQPPEVLQYSRPHGRLSA